MYKFQIKKYSLCLVNIFIFLMLFFFTCSKLKYSYVQNDDILDLMNNKLWFGHGRYYCDLLSYFWVIYLPKLFNITIQDFAFVSESINKAFCWVLICFMTSNFININNKFKKLVPVCFVFSFFYIVSLLFETNFLNLFHTNQYFNSYVFPLIFLFLFSNKIFDLYVNNKEPSKKEFSILSVIVILLSLGNQQLLTFCSGMLLFIFADYLIKTKKVNYKYLILIVFAIITDYFVITSHGFKALCEVYAPELNLNFQLSNIMPFLTSFTDLIIIKNWFMYLFGGGLFIILFLYDKKEKIRNIRILKYTVFSIISFFIFYFALYLCGETYTIFDLVNNQQQMKYFLYYPPLLFCFKLFLYVINLILLSFVLNINNNKNIIKNIFCIIFCLYCGINIFRYCENKDFWCLEDKKFFYSADKMSVFWFSQGKTAIVPVDNLNIIVPVIKWFFPEEIANNTYRGIVFYKNRCHPYFSYLEKAYGVNTNPGMTFLPYDEALEIFKQNGGVLTEEELNDLKFSRIKQQFVEKAD